ncbi:hypothetical protein [Streptomyces sp. NPDC086989]|uniref:hypothetical protein n=1 Tax=Streptomyces sp. NPDC086989 TaxID=3365764 RepID=UPI00382B5D0C
MGSRKHSTATAGGPSFDLVVTQDDLGAVGHEAFVIHGDLRKKSDIAGAGATSRAAAECSAKNLAMGSELWATLSTWDAQVKTVLQMYAHISNHLDYSKQPTRTTTTIPDGPGSEVTRGATLETAAGR